MIVSLAPRLQPGAKRRGTTLNRFNGFSGYTEAVETALASLSSGITGLKPRC
jgi:hypothetical protein